jgi:CRP-like cAMP-binding protein/Fe-S-cluster-containing hydrogenase component 2/thioredoxin reductase
MSPDVRIAIVGSGPAGLSAAARAAEQGVSHVLLERADHPSDTVFRFQKGKFVMSTPDALPLRSPLPFAAGRREEVLAGWQSRVVELGVSFRANAEVKAISGRRGDFTLSLADGGSVRAETVVLAIGLQGNINRLAVPGADLPHIQYQLDDPDEYELERIVVIGAGDAAIENALALSRRNTVYIANRGDEFARAKPANEQAIMAAISSGRIVPIWNAETLRAAPGSIAFSTPDGETEIACDRVIARIGASPPRRFVEACGVAFPSPDRDALPECSAQYESNVPGLYIVGALGGYPLIKQALNQGYEVVEHILGNPVEPADAPILRKKFEGLGNVAVDDVLESVRNRIPLLSGLNLLMLREMMAEANIHRLRRGDTVFRRNDYTNSLFAILDGAVDIEVDPANPDRRVRLDAGAFFGEMGLISGRRRNATVLAASDCVLVEIPRRTMLRLRAAVPSVRAELDREAAIRQIQSHIAPGLDRDALAAVADTAEIRSFAAGEALFNEGEPGDALYLIRKGSVAVSRRIGGRETVLSYAPAGHYVGEMALMTDAPRTATVRAAVACEAVRLEGEAFKSLIAGNPAIRASVEGVFRDRLAQNARMGEREGAGDVLGFLLSQGIGEATDVLVIDETLCIGCDNCERACAGTHGGISRLDREAGPSFAALLLPTSCRHCEHPHCMTDCPPDAIHRSPDGEVYIDDSCIGCGNCERNCPYGVIRMAAPAPAGRSLLMRLLFGEAPETEAQDDAPKKAVKCDMCRGIETGPACVHACPTGAALRMSPEVLLSVRERPI